MDPNKWGDLLFTYGPYAVLVLFSLWVAPKQTQEFLKCTQGDKAQRYLCGSVAVMCWVIVVAMVVFIYHNWPPQIVYQGSLGMYGQETEFVTSDDNFYISTELLPDNRLKWKFAIVTKSSERDPNRSYEFTRLLNKKPKDYAIKLADLQAGHVNLQSHPNDPEKLILEGQELKSIARIDPNRFPGKDWMTVYAQANQYDYIIQALISPNPYFQAQARRQLRALPEETLKEWLKRSDLPHEARRQVESELERRSLH